MTHIVIPAFSFVLTALAVAQEFRANVRLLAFERVGEETEVVVTDAEGKALADKPVALPTQQLSAAREFSRRGLVFRAVDDKTKVLGRVELPADAKEVFLVFLPVPAGAAESYRVHALSMPADRFGSGDYAFLNYSGKDVRCVIGKERLQVAHGKAAIYQAAKDQKGGGTRSIVCYAKTAEGAWEARPFFSSRIIVQEGVRNLIFICRHPVTGNIDFRGIADFVVK
jgi:hypothetical protein